MNSCNTSILRKRILACVIDNESSGIHFGPKLSGTAAIHTLKHAGRSRTHLQCTAGGRSLKAVGQRAGDTE
ncbi:hypothetical protein AGOR_G00194990 [Albula goreensis]|uniref:Uncharacterized protein n=1 Tax=Albula goreensis TaxID=1534307 RepID=A0A8T3CX31_9TELE|nr:hypothetical protein AGOR_G00194990 [Albula goreensis]